MSIKIIDAMLPIAQSKNRDTPADDDDQMLEFAHTQLVGRTFKDQRDLFNEAFELSAVGRLLENWDFAAVSFLEYLAISKNDFADYYVFEFNSRAGNARPVYAVGQYLRS